MIEANADTAAIEVARTWRGPPAGEEVLAVHPELARASADFSGEIDRVVRAWQGEVLDLVRTEGGSMGGEAICSFSIPLITIIAMFVLSLFLPIVVLWLKFSQAVA